MDRSKWVNHANSLVSITKCQDPVETGVYVYNWFETCTLRCFHYFKHVETERDETSRISTARFPRTWLNWRFAYLPVDEQVLPNLIKFVCQNHHAGRYRFTAIRSTKMHTAMTSNQKGMANTFLQPTKKNFFLVHSKALKQIVVNFQFVKLKKKTKPLNWPQKKLQEKR